MELVAAVGMGLDGFFEFFDSLFDFALALEVGLNELFHGEDTTPIDIYIVKDLLGKACVNLTTCFLF